MTSNTTLPPADAGQLDQPVRPASEAPRWWHCDTHGPGRLNAWGCPDCVAELRRWKSTHAPRLEALEGLLHAAQHEAHAGREAIAALASERAANAVLTDEVERLQSTAAEVIAAFEALGTARGATANVLARQRCEKSMVALKAAVFRPNVANNRTPTAPAVGGPS